MAYGTVNADVIQSSVSGVSLGAGNATSFKNRLINGAMVIDQRNAGGAGSTAINLAPYSVDRWQVYGDTVGKFTYQQNAGSVTPPAGYNNYLGITSSSAYPIISTSTFLVRQFIEGYNIADLAWGTASAKSVTLSFWVYSSLTGTFGGSLINGSENYAYPFSYTISSANTWTQISISVAGPTAGTWAKTNTAAVEVVFSLGIGSTYSGTAGSWSANAYFSATGATSVVGTNGATFYITGIQLEVGSSATGFDYRSYGTELALCQRYNIRWGSPDTSARFTAVGYGGGGSTSGIVLQNPVTMRAAPTFSYALGSGLSVNDGTAAYTASSLSGSTLATSQSQITINQSSSVTSKGLSVYANATDFYINLSAEL